MISKTSTARTAKDAKRVLLSEQYRAKFKAFFPSGLDKHFEATYTHRTADAYFRHLALFGDFAQSHGVENALALTPKVLRIYYNQIRTQKTAQIIFVALRQAYRFYEQKNLIARSPVTSEFSISANVRRTPPTTVLTAEQLRIFFECFPLDDARGARDHALYSAVFYTCSRLELVAELKREDYDGDVVRMKTKTIPVHPTLRESIERYLEFLPPLSGHDPLFQSFGGRGKNLWLKGQRLDAKSARAFLAVATDHVRRKTGLQISTIISSDIIRDSALMIYLQNGGNLRTAMELAGQKTLDFLLRFIDLSEIRLSQDDVLRIRF